MDHFGVREDARVRGIETDLNAHAALVSGGLHETDCPFREIVSAHGSERRCRGAREGQQFLDRVLDVPYLPLHLIDNGSSVASVPARRRTMSRPLATPTTGFLISCAIPLANS